MTRLPVAAWVLDSESKARGAAARAGQGQAGRGPLGRHVGDPGRPLPAPAKAQAGAAVSPGAAVPRDTSSG